MGECACGAGRCALRAGGSHPALNASRAVGRPAGESLQLLPVRCEKDGLANRRRHARGRPLRGRVPHPAPVRGRAGVGSSGECLTSSVSRGFVRVCRSCSKYKTAQNYIRNTPENVQKAKRLAIERAKERGIDRERPAART